MTRRYPTSNDLNRIAVIAAISALAIGFSGFCEAQDDAQQPQEHRPFSQRFSPGRDYGSSEVVPQRYSTPYEPAAMSFEPRPSFGSWTGSGGTEPQYSSEGGRAQPGTFESDPIETGYVFLDGKYLAPPYQVRVSDGTVYINEEPLSGLSAANGQDDRDSRGWGSRGAGFRENPYRRIIADLDSGHVVFAYAEQPLMTLNDTLATREFLAVVTAGDKRSDALDELEAVLPDNVDYEKLSSWLSGFTPPPELIERAKADIAAYDATEASNLESIAATRRADVLAYPLTVVGMMLAVFAVGHVLLTRPPEWATKEAADASPKAIRSVGIAVLLILILSGLDLAWTILAWQAGQMRELNPLGSQLIQNPAALVAFKTTVTLLAAGLLFALRRHQSAQYGAWWLCLLLTILTFRWLTFNSLFVS